jgi:hypothetical protein
MRAAARCPRGALAGHPAIERSQNESRDTTWYVPARLPTPADELRVVREDR